jgi:hypothetical protein
MPGDRRENLMERGNPWAGLIFFAALLFMLAALTVYAYLGTFTRYMADDYCTAAAVKDGFWGAQAYWWENWSGRYSFTFLVSFVELFGLRIVPILPALIMSLWLFSAVWACLPLLKHLNVSNYISGSVFLASVALWLTYRSVPDYPQVVFWQTGILTYPISLVLFLLGVGIAVRRSFTPARVSWIKLFSWFLFAFLAGGFSETGVIVQIALLASILIFMHMAKKDLWVNFSPILLATLIGSALSLLVIAVSPGNVVRSEGFQNIPPLGPSLLNSLIETLRFIPDLFDRHTLMFVFGFLAGGFFVYFCMREGVLVSNSSIARHFVASLVFAEAGILAGIAPAYLLRGGVPPERVLLFSYFLVACLVIYWGVLSALLLRSNLPQATRNFQAWISLGLLVLFIAWGVIPFVASQLHLVPPLKEYSVLWDERHRSLLSASQNDEPIVLATDLTKVEALRELRTRLWLTGDLETSPDHWVNRCAAQYYEVNQISVK